MRHIGPRTEAASMVLSACSNANKGTASTACLRKEADRLDLLQIVHWLCRETLSRLRIRYLNLRENDFTIDRAPRDPVLTADK
eukprot:IDg17123t1